MPFQNQTLQSLLDGVINGSRVTIKHDENFKPKVERALSDTPISLSENQKHAIVNAWINDISYIQGPPGTGKSHTIVALMLTALLLNKKVLLISQKPAAIEVVRKRINDFLNDEHGVVTILSESSERAHLRGYINELIQQARNDAPLFREQELQDRRNTKEEKEGKLGEKQTRLNEILKQANDFYRANKEFLNQREEFQEDFAQESLAQSLSHLSALPKQPNLERAVAALEKTNRLQSQWIQRKEALYLLMLYKALAVQLKADYNLLKSRGYQYGERYLQLVKAFLETQASTPSQRTDLALLRREIERISSELFNQKKEYLKLQFKHQRLASARQYSNDLGMFARMLRFVSPRQIQGCLQQINFSHLTEVFPLWMSELRYVGRWIPMQSNIFDLVVVDEASQVNLAEVLPAFYRAKRICVVGDDKQLGLASAGLFKINGTIERLVWQKHFPNNSFQEAEQRKLLVSKSSILDFIIQLNVPRVMLKEHFRSFPQLAKFTSNQFYGDEGGLRIMTELPEHNGKPCFEAIYVNGERENNNKFVPHEITKAVEIVKSIILNQSYLQEPLVRLGFTEQTPPSVGVLTFLTESRDKLIEQLEEVTELTDEQRNKHQLFVATTEEFQGNERDIMIIVAGLGRNSPFGPSFYQNPNHFNVATSRAKRFTYFIYGGIPEGANLVKGYLQHFGFKPHIILDTPPEHSFAQRPDLWRYDERNRESEFEIRVSEYLIKLAEKHHYKLFNQVPSCGYRLDFVLHNPANNKCVAIEVDGKQHFTENGRTYHIDHLERVEVLQRAGWKIVHIPYYKWYRNGWLCDKDNDGFNQSVVAPLIEELQEVLV